MASRPDGVGVALALWVGLAATGGAQVACGATDDGPPLTDVWNTGEEGTSADDRPAPENDLGWARCSLVTGEDDAPAECAEAELPLHWSDPAGSTIPIFVKRFRTTSRPRGQLWLLNGGPGDSGAGFEGLIEPLLEAASDLEIYMPDHRGTGRSSARLTCPEQERASSDEGVAITEAEWDECRSSVLNEWGEGLSGFTVTAAARDIGELIERTRHVDDEVYLYGVSYGTYWLQRYLQLYPDQADGAVLDSICAPGECEFLLRYDELFNDNGRTIFEACDSDPECSARLGGDAWAAVGALLDRLDTGHCAELGLDRTGLRQLLALHSMDWLLRQYLPAVVYRIERCAPEDIEVFEHFAGLIEELMAPDPYSSLPLTVNIGLAEFSLIPPPSLGEVEAHAAPLRVSPDTGPQLRALLDGWPRYERDEYYGRFAQSDVPLLMLSGTLDPQTPLEVGQPTRDHFVGPHQTAVVVERSAHGVIVQSPLDRFGLQTCGLELMGQFLADPSAELDVGCRDQVLPLAFDGDPIVTPILYGVEDAWENGSGTSGQSLESAGANGRDAVRALARRLRLVRRARLSKP